MDLCYEKLCLFHQGSVVYLNWNGVKTESILLSHGSPKYIESVCKNIEEQVAEFDASSDLTDHVLNLVFDSTGSSNANLFN